MPGNFARGSSGPSGYFIICQKPSRLAYRLPRNSNGVAAKFESKPKLVPLRENHFARLGFLRQDFPVRAHPPSTPPPTNAPGIAMPVSRRLRRLRLRQPAT